MTGQAMTEPEIDPADSRAARFPVRLRLLGLGVAAVVLAGGGYWFVSQNGAAEATDEPGSPPSTATVTRETISDTRSFRGTLGHGQARTVTLGGSGVITGIADAGAEIARGDELFRLNERPVTALFGAIPMYRDLGEGDSGGDVAQLVENLTALGYADCEDEDWFSWCVSSAVREWQADLGLPDTGTVARTDVVFVAEGTRVDTVHPAVGEVVTPGVPVLDLTGVDQVLSLEVEVRDRELLAAGTEVTVELPGGVALPGAVTDARAVPAEPDSDEETVIAVEVTLTGAADEPLLGADADAVVDVGQREDVLTVPVNALLALAGGGHGLEVVAEDGTTTLVPVEAGLFAQGRVEIEGAGITEGTVVGVAGR